MAPFMQQSSMCGGPEPCATCGKQPRVAGASGVEREMGRREGANSKGPSRTTYHTLDLVLPHHLSASHHNRQAFMFPFDGERNENSDT